MIQFTWYIDSGAEGRLPNAKRFAQRAIEQAEKRNQRYVSKYVTDGDTKFSVNANRQGRYWYAHVKITQPSGTPMGWKTTQGSITATCHQLITEVFDFTGNVVKTLRDIVYPAATVPASVITQCSTFVSEDTALYFEYSSDGTARDYETVDFRLNLIINGQVAATYETNLAAELNESSFKSRVHFSNDGTKIVITFDGQTAGTVAIIKLSVIESDGEWQFVEDFRVQYNPLGDAVDGHVDPFFFGLLTTDLISGGFYTGSEHIAPDMQSILLNASSDNIGYEAWAVSISLVTGAVEFIQNMDFTDVTNFPETLPDFTDSAWHFVYAESGDVFALISYLAEITFPDMTRLFRLFKNGTSVWSEEVQTDPVGAGFEMAIFAQGRMNVSSDGGKYSFVLESIINPPVNGRRIDYFQYREGETNIIYQGSVLAADGVNPRHQHRVVISRDGEAAIVRGLTSLHSSHVFYTRDGALEIIPISGDTYPSPVTVPAYPWSRKGDEEFFLPYPENTTPNPTYLFRTGNGQTTIEQTEVENEIVFTYNGTADPETSSPVSLTKYLGHENFIAADAGVPRPGNQVSGTELAETYEGQCDPDPEEGGGDL